MIEISRVSGSLRTNRGEALNSFYLPQISSVAKNIIYNMLLLLSFGLSSPVLCFGICMNSIITVSSYLIRLGRLVFHWEDALRTGGCEAMGESISITFFS
jgi:hypothetical protein